MCVTLLQFRRDLWQQKTRLPNVIVWRCLCDDKFIRFDETPMEHGLTDRQTDRSAIAYAVLAWLLVAKKRSM